ncbi:hypothetical protein E4U30_003744 [Claviceps sp. LM220 group G6]|nr:hypothetical protein E4U30_003744 [Claviceps sp. LM220 group G6]KAG6095347.1 hypothetical protein E4U31_005914 [Claviceps sp. LM219 group G6]
MGRQIRPARVFKTVTQELTHEVLAGHVAAPPPWYQVMSDIPPAESIIRTVNPYHQTKRKATKPMDIYRPQNIKYPEDSLRATFYKDHPWELARPRVVIESDGKDARYCDWSKGLRQPGVALTGECVVQRQLYLMQTERMGRAKAYDKVRREFYRLRQAEEVENRVAIEEAKYVGAYFGKTRLDVGMQLEDQEFEKWKVWAGKEKAKRELRHNEDIGTFGAEEEEVEETLTIEEAAPVS